jgi:hypothetical protein
MNITNTRYRVIGGVTLRDSSKLIIRQSVIEKLGILEEGMSIYLGDSSILLAGTTIIGLCL